MKIRKKLATVLTLLTLTASSASAEHPSAQRYREMLQSENFYLEYEMVDENEKNKQMGYSNLEILSSHAGKRMASSAPIKRERKTSKLPGIFGMIAGGGLDTKRGCKAPKTLYTNGKYYIFGNPFRPSMEQLTQIMEQMRNKHPKLDARVCQAGLLNSPELDPTESWDEVQASLELPDALSVFTDEDSFQEQQGRIKMHPNMLGKIFFSAWYRDYNMPPRTSPRFTESRKVTLDKKEYDCDRYVAEIKTVGGTVAGQIFYDVLYDGEGKLSQIRRCFSRNGKEESLGNMEIWELTSELPGDAFFISDKPMKVYAAGMGDVNDFLGIEVQVGTIGGSSTNAK